MRRRRPRLKTRRRIRVERGVQVRAVRTIIVALMFIGIATEGHAQQPDTPVNIPLGFTIDPKGEVKLAINVGINGGDPKPYVFDTGSPVFNAVYNEDWWPGFSPDPNHNDAPGSTVRSPDEGRLMNNAQFCLGGSSPTFCRGYTGNLVEVPSLDFYATTSDPTPAVTLSADPGYVVNAAYNYGAPDGTQNGLPFEANDPPVDTFFFGTFGAGNFLKNVPIVENPESPPGTQSNYFAGGVLGQTLVSGVTQGYVVAANGQKNPFSPVNEPQQVNGINVTVGGQTMQPVTPCSPCVTVGLTPEMLGQFWAATPTDGGSAGVIPWADTSTEKFQNPYGGDPRNNSSSEFGTNYKTTLISPYGKSVITEQSGGLLDTGTPQLTLGTTASLKQAEKVSDSCNISVSNPTEFTCDVKAGATLKIAGAAPDGKAIPGLTTTPMTLTNTHPPDESNPSTYNASLSNEKSTNTIGIPFFLQNSVMYDLTNRVIGYTPFFVTDAPLMTTAGGPLIVDSTNVPLGLAGVVSGAGGVTIDAGGKVQLSAPNSYTGLTQVFGGAKLFISGPGSIAASSGVFSNGIFDISRAWSAVSIQDLTGSGDTRLGGQNLIITNAAGTFSGRISDGGAYPGPGTGGSLTLAGGALILSGANTYSGPTWVNQGALIVNGSLVSPVTVNYSGLLGGIGSVGATTIENGGTLAPGNSIGTMTVNGNLTLNPGALYEVEANAQGQSDKVVVKGTVNLTGATLRVLAAGGAYKPNTDYVIVDNDGSDAVNGKFGQVTNNLAFLIPSVIYDGDTGNDVVLKLERNSTLFSDVAKTRNQRAVAGALDRFPTNDPLFLAVVNQTEQGGRQAFDALSGEIHATVAGTLADDSRYVREAILGRLMQAGYTSGNQQVAALGAGGPKVASLDGQAMALGYGSKSLGDAPVYDRSPLAFWTRAYGAWADFDGDRNAAKADRDLGGFVSGMDAQVSGSWRVGLATGASFSNVDVDARYSSADVETYYLGGYLGGMAGPLALRGGGAWAWNDIDTSRAVIFPGFFERHKASYNADTGQIFGEVAYPTQMGGIALEPFAGLAYVSIDTDRFHERGEPLASLRGLNADQDVGYSTVGLRAATTMHWGAMQVTPHISAAWQHAFDDVTPGAALAFAFTGIGFSITGVPLAEDSALVDTGLDFALGARTTAGVSYSGQFGDSVTDNAVRGRFTWLF